MTDYRQATSPYLQVPEQLLQPCLVSLSHRHLVCAEPRAVRSKFLHLYQRRGEAAIGHHRRLLSDPRLQHARQLSVLVRFRLWLLKKICKQFYWHLIIVVAWLSYIIILSTHERFINALTVHLLLNDTTI